MDNAKKKVAIFGAGIAGMTAAHEFVKRGHIVTVYEANKEAGGFFRSARREEDNGMPSEYSWHGFGPWYHNVFDIMKEIPFDESGNLYEKSLSRPIDFGLASEDGKAAFDDTWFLNVKNMFRLSWVEVVLASWLMLKTWTSNRRSWESYAKMNAARSWRPFLGDTAYLSWRACFGPWIGSDWTNVSLHTAGHFFRKQLITKPEHFHAADEDGPAWKHGARSGWLLLKGPSNEYWFDRWVSFLKARGVIFHWKQKLDRFDYEQGRIKAAHLAGGEEVRGDIFVLATNPFAAADIIGRSGELEQLDQLKLLKPLIQGGPHTQVSLRIALGDKIAWPRERAGVIVVDSEYDLTLFAQEQAWDEEVKLGEGVNTLLTVTACVATVPGRVFGLPMINCTKEQFLEEVKAQLFACEGLNEMVRKANNNRSLTDFPILKMEVWHEWEFAAEGIKYQQPKWVNRTGNQQFLPEQETPVPNLVLAGAHTLTDVDVWSIEAAVESGKRAVKVFEPSVKVVPQYKPVWLRVLWIIDDWLYGMGAPQLLEVVGIFSLVLLVLGVIGAAGVF